MMRGRSILSLTIAMIVLSGACGPKATPPATEGPIATPSIQPINLGGPQMTVGESWLYADGSMLVPVPAGAFTMGNGANDRPEGPEHLVELDDYWIYRHKVTNRQYAYCVAQGGCTPPAKADNPNFESSEHENNPVVGVNHAQAAAYCEFVHARLPTEAEWEKAARGPDANLYPWGEAAPSCDLLNYADCEGATTPVDRYPLAASHYGALDMEGNTLEWVADWFSAEYYAESPALNPPGPADGRERSVRSSAFNSGGDRVPAYTRASSPPQTQRDNLGFRCVVDDPQYFAPFCSYPGIYETAGAGGPGGGSDPELRIECPDLSLTEDTYCEGSEPKTRVIASISDLSNGFEYRIQGCMDDHSTAGFAFVCSPPAQVRFCSHCSVFINYKPQCPAGYTLDEAAHVCVAASASADACLPGYILIEQSGGQCCVVDPGTAPPMTPAPGSAAPTPTYGMMTNLLPSSACPAGSWAGLTPDWGWACIPVPVEEPYCVSGSVSFRACVPSGGPEGDPNVGGGCQITEQSCGNSCLPYGYIYNPTACTCDCLPG